MRQLLILLTFVLLLGGGGARADDCQNEYTLFGPVSLEWTAQALQIQECIKKNNKPVLINMSTMGGDAAAALAFYDLLATDVTVREKITTRAHGEVLSAGVTAFLAGKVRLVACSSLLLIHPTTLTFGKNVEVGTQAMQGIMKRIQFQDDRFVQILVENSRLKKEEAEKMNAQETYLTPKEAIDAGIATASICPG